MQTLLIALLSLHATHSFAAGGAQLASEMALVLQNPGIQSYIEQQTQDREDVSTYFKGISLGSIQIQCIGSTSYDLNFDVMTVEYERGYKLKKCRKPVQVGTCQGDNQYSLGEGPKEIIFSTSAMVCD
jgi:hypothetical protein